MPSSRAPTFRRSPAAHPGGAALTVTIDEGGVRTVSGELAPTTAEPITVDGFVAARRLGFRHMETDVRLIASGELVAFHEVAGSVESSSLSELRRAHGPIPTVDQLLEHPSLGGVKWNLELKGGDVETARALAEVLQRTSAAARVCISFGLVVMPAAVAAIRDALPDEVCMSASLLERAIDWAVFGGLLSSASIDERVGCTQVASEPVPGAGLLQVGEADVEQAHDRGLAIHVYDVLQLRTDLGDVERLLDIGVDGIISDDHEIVRAAFLERGLWPQPDRTTLTSPG